MSRAAPRTSPPIRCPDCRSEAVRKRGRHSKDGAQKYQCTACRRHFRRRYKAKGCRAATRREVARLSDEGRSGREIAARLGVSPATVSRHRKRAAAEERDAPMTFAYADPPYLGQARRHYRGDPRCAEVNHPILIAHLCDEYPDGWALSCSSTSLRVLLPLCPPDVRVLAWVKPFCSFKRGVGVAYAWEPVILRGGRRRRRDQGTVRDWTSANVTLRAGVAGAKPRAFARWLFGVLNAGPRDALHDLFPGSGAVARAWEEWREQARKAPAAGGETDEN